MFTIEFDKTDMKKYIKSVENVKKTIEKEEKELPKSCAKELANAILENISNQAFAMAPYNQRYAQWKQDRVGHLKYWLLDGDLYGSIKAFKYEGFWFAGIQPGIFDKGGKSWHNTGGRPMEIVKYARWLEKGRKGQPARPLFAPTTENYSKAGFIKQHEKSAKTIESKWR